MTRLKIAKNNKYNNQYLSTWRIVLKHNQGLLQLRNWLKLMIRTKMHSK